MNETTESFLEKLQKEMKYMKNHGVRVGIFGEEGNKQQEGVKIIDYASYLITGTWKMPPRDFMKVVKGREGRLKVTRLQKSVLKKVFKLEITGKQALSQIGVEVVQIIKKNIVEGDFAPLAESTLKNKKRNKNNILRENDFLLNSITFEVVKI